MADQLVTAGLSLLGGGALGACGKALLDYLSQRDRAATSRAARQEDQDDAIRGELWQQVRVLQGQVVAIQGKLAECERRGLTFQRDLYLRDAHIALLRLRLEQAGISLGDMSSLSLVPFTATIVPTASATSTATSAAAGQAQPPPLEGAAS